MYKNSNWREIVDRKFRTVLAYLVCNASEGEWFTHVGYFLDLVADQFQPEYQGEWLLKIKAWVDKRLATATSEVEWDSTILALERGKNRIADRLAELDTGREKDEYRAAGLQEALVIVEDILAKENEWAAFLDELREHGITRDDLLRLLRLPSMTSLIPIDTGLGISAEKVRRAIKEYREQEKHDHADR